MNLATPSRFPLDRAPGQSVVWVVLPWGVVLLVAAAFAVAALVVAAQLDPDLTGSWRWSDAVRLLA